jgi:hypothetical protein
VATHYHEAAIGGAAPIAGTLADPSRAIIAPVRDAILLWGAPLIAFIAVQLWVRGFSTLAPEPVARTAIHVLVSGVGILTFAHLIAVVPRAYLNRQVFAAYRTRLTIVPVVLVTALLVSPTVLVVAGIIAVLWDVHHSAMQNFGFARLYDLKAGNPPTLLRATDLRLNWVMYVGPLLAGTALLGHFDHFPHLDGTALAALTRVPGVLQGQQTAIRDLAILSYAVVLAWAAIDYARAMRDGYRLPAHKLATLLATGAVSILAWGFSPPLIALAAINLYHAVQYFALVWLKEGARMTGLGRTQRRAAIVFALACAAFGIGYAIVGTGPATLWLAPFVACSLLHFWYDGFIWSVRRQQV